MEHLKSSLGQGSDHLESLLRLVTHPRWRALVPVSIDLHVRTELELAGAAGERGGVREAEEIAGRALMYLEGVLSDGI
ncbi:MAG TPA: hypothetical protein VEX38_01335 [Fimbriimonadaceae bacterium]|nr:hypothetical protein [Fimbriimonadaceae bacterium]